MKFFVIGGAGYIGSHFVRQAEEEGHQCVVYDNLCLGHREALRPSTELIQADLLDSVQLRAALEAQQADAVFHFAAFALVGESVANPQRYYENNVEGVRILMNALKDISPQTPLIFSSSCAVFGIPSRLPIAEDDPKAPISPYGRSKLMAEYIIEDYAHAYGMKAMSLRYFNACGAHPEGDIGEDHQPETHLLPNILKAALNDEELQIFGSNFPTPDGTCLRDYIHVMDLAVAHIQAAKYLLTCPKGSYDSAHLGTGNGYSNLEVLKAVEEVLQKKLRFRFAEARPGDPPALYAATEKAKKLLGFEPQHSDLLNIVQTAWQWHQKHPHGYNKD